MGWQNPPVPDLEAALAAQGPAGYWRLSVELMETNCRKGPVGPVSIATAYAYLRDRARALTWLKKLSRSATPG